MSMLSYDDAQRMPGATMYATDGNKIGKVTDVYIDSDTKVAEWALVDTGFFGTKESFVPLAEARMDGDDLRVPYSKDQVKDAPNAEPDGELSQDEESRLYDHYGLTYTEGPSDSGLPAEATGQAPAEPAPVAAPAQPVGRDTSGPTTDDAMTVSEERMNVDVVRRPSESVRLRKHVVTEMQTVTVPVTKERVKLEREPITEANAGQAMDGPDLSEEEHEVVLTEERAVVTKETVPVERVRLDKQEVTENVTVQEELRKEQVEVDDDTGRSRTDRADTGRTDTGLSS
jgi:uncharacterized protein (TIGR02271 family)